MATLKHITEGEYTTNSTAISNSGWGTGTRGIISVATAYSSTSTVTHTATGGNVTWTVELHQTYRARRGMTVLVSDGTPDGSDITITASSTGGSYQESMYSIDELAEFDSTGVVVASNSDDTGTSTTEVTIPTLGHTGDEVIFAAGACESGSANFAAESGATDLHTVIEGGANVRSFLAADFGSDTTPSFTYDSGSHGAGMIGVRFSDGTDGSHAAPGGGGIASGLTLLGVGS